MSRLKQNQNIDNLIKGIEVITESQYSLSEQDRNILNEALEKKYKQKVYIATEKESQQDVDLMKKYFTEKFQIKVNGKLKPMNFGSKEVEENVAANTLGTIIHETLEALYKPFINTFLTATNLEKMLSLANEEVLQQFKAIYKEGEVKKGKNLLAFEVAKRNVFNFLMEEKKQIENGDAIKILALETPLERILKDERLPFPIKIAGNVDRIEIRNNKIRIIDYKTGKVDKNNVQLKDWTGLTLELKNDKIIQLLCYAFMYEEQTNGLEMEAGIISFKNMKGGFLPFGLKQEKEFCTTITPDTLAHFKTELIILINEILNSEIPFEEKI